jgi:hypothetical protein
LRAAAASGSRPPGPVEILAGPVSAHAGKWWKSAFVAHAHAGRVGALQVTNHALRRSQRMRRTWLRLANQPIISSLKGQFPSSVVSITFLSRLHYFEIIPDDLNIPSCFLKDLWSKHLAFFRMTPIQGCSAIPIV